VTPGAGSNYYSERPERLENVALPANIVKLCKLIEGSVNGHVRSLFGHCEIVKRRSDRVGFMQD